MEKTKQIAREDMRALDQVRQRLSQLSSSIAALRADLERSETLPTCKRSSPAKVGRPSLQSSAQALSFNLQQFNETFNTHRQILNRSHAYPLPNFPGLTQEALLSLLLRKKLEPGTEDWVEEYTVRYGKRESEGVNGSDQEVTALSSSDMRELWSWAHSTSEGIVGPMLEDDLFEDNFTIAERKGGVQKVVTGLKRNLDDGSDDDDEDDDVEGDKDAGDDTMEGIVLTAPKVEEDKAEEGIDPSLPPMPIESVMKFMITGAMPSSTVLPNR